MCFHKSLLIGAHGAPPALVAAPPRCDLCVLCGSEAQADVTTELPGYLQK
jgi:hypothetical protein